MNAPAKLTLLHGLADDVALAMASRAFAARLERIAWPMDLVESAADHVAARIAATLGR